MLPISKSTLSYRTVQSITFKMNREICRSFCIPLHPLCLHNRRLNTCYKNHSISNIPWKMQCINNGTNFRIYKRCYQSDSQPITTIKQTLDHYKNKLSDAQIPEPELSTEYIVSHVLQLSRKELTTYGNNDTIGRSDLDEIERLITCRLVRMPVQYIIGNWDFHNITLQIRPPVFIPRPETEELVELALEKISTISNPRVLEIGCGSGAISLAMLNMNKTLECTAIDQSQHAINMTIENARNLQLSERIHLIHGKVGHEDNISLPHSEYDMIISNPPYVLRKDLMHVDPEIMLYEDLRALDGGKDGLEVIKSILRDFQHILQPDKEVLLEIDPCHQYLLPEYIDKNKDTVHFVVKDIISDINKHKRFIVLAKI